MLALAQCSDQPFNDRTSVMARRSSQRKITADPRLLPADARMSSEAMRRWSRTVTQQLLAFAPPTTKTVREAIERFRLEEMSGMRPATRNWVDRYLRAIELETAHSSTCHRRSSLDSSATRRRPSSGATSIRRVTTWRTQQRASVGRCWKDDAGDER